MKRQMRSLAVVLVFGGVGLAASAAGAAQNYLMTGKFARSNGPVINIPLIGNNPGNTPNCGRTTMNGAMIPGMTPIVQGYRSSITMTMVATPPITMTMFANPQGCISGAGKVTATAPGAGKAVKMPSMAFVKPFPGMTVAVHVPIQPNIPQLATSWRITAPPMGIGTLADPPNGTMNNGMNTAVFRYFHKSAWLTETGRAGPKFTWCFGNAACTKISQAMGVDKNGDPNLAYPVHQLMVKYTPGPNRFGGTMSHVVSAGVNPSSLAITVGGAIQFLSLAGIGEAVTGRGYADFLTDALMGGDAFAMFMVGPVYVPQLMSSQSLITTLMTMVPASGTQATVAVNKVFGFPFTTGTVLARNTGTDAQKNPLVVTLTGMGGDLVTAMGARNISLVAGGLAGIDTLATEYPSLDQIFLPEPAGSAPAIAGVLSLLAMGLSRAKRRVGAPLRADERDTKQ